MTPEQTKEAEELIKSMEAGNNHPAILARFNELAHGIKSPYPIVIDHPPLPAVPGTSVDFKG